MVCLPSLRLTPSQILLSLFLVLGSQLTGWAQSVSLDTADYPYWIEMMQDENANFFETQRAFEKYWDGRTIDKGSGWKPFKRWESFMETRVKPNGDRYPADHVWNEYEQYKQLQLQQDQSESIGGTWTEIGPIQLPTNGTGQPNGLGRINGIGFHPTDTNTYLVGAPQGGLWKTTDDGTTWTSNTDDLPTLGVSSIVYDYNQPDTIYIGTGDRDGGDAPGLGVMKSVDGGANWNFANTGMGNRVVGMMVIHPTNPSILIAATSGGIYKSTDGAGSWVQVSSNSNHYKDIRFMPGNPSIVYATEGGRFYRSADTGDTWTQITSGLPSSTRMVIGVTPDDSTYVYLLLAQGSVYKGTYRSTDGGLNFTEQSTTPNLMDYSTNGSGNSGQAWYDLCIAIDPLDKDVVYVGGVNIFKSTDGGQTWLISAHWVGGGGIPSIHADQHALEYSPLNGKLYSGNDGGVYDTDDGGASWQDISSGLGIAQIYRIGQSAIQNDMTINGYQDNGTAIYDGSWRTEIGGDGMECIVDPTDDNFQYGELYFGAIRRSTNMGFNFSTIAGSGVNGITEGGPWITSYILHHDDPSTMFAGYKNVWRSNNVKEASGVSFTAISNNLAGSNSVNIRMLKQSKVDVDKLYMARHDEKFFRSNNVNSASPSWNDLTGWLPNSTDVIDIETHPTDANTVYIIQSNSVYKSTNQGINWTNITGTLPNVSLNCLLMNEYSHEGLFVGTDAGVYFRDSTMTDWVPFLNGLPVNSEVTELEVFYDYNDFAQSRIKAATYGRGLWESDLYDPGNIAPLANFQATRTEVTLCDTGSIRLLDYTAYAPTSWQWTITPSTFNYVNGTDSTSSVPEVKFTTTGQYTFTLVVSNSFGSDSLTKSAYVEVTAGTDLALLEDFETFLNCGTSNCVLDCTLDNEWYNVPNGAGDDIDFRTDNGGTPSGTTGPSVDYNPGTAAGKYLYTEASFCFNNEALLESPCLDLSSVTVPRVKFAYHMNGFSMGELHMDIFSNGSWTNDIMPAITGGQGTAWNTDSVLLNQYAGNSVKLRFRALTGPNYSSDIAIDDIGVLANPKADFTASELFPCPGDTVTFTDNSSQNPNAWNWSFFPTTVTFINGTSASSQHPVVVVNSTGLYDVSLEVSNAFGSHTKNKNNYILSSVPNSTLTSDVIGTELCDGDTVEFTAGPIGHVYSFAVDGQVVQNNDTANYTTTLLQNGQVITVTVTDSNGCFADAFPITATVHPLPTPLLVSSDNDNEICEGDTVVFTETNGGSAYIFTRDGILAQLGGNNTYQTSDLIDGEEVHVELTDSNGCKRLSNGITTMVFPTPATPVISLVQTNDSLKSSVVGDSYVWSLNDTVLAGNGQTNPLQGFGNYVVQVIENGCLSDPSEPFLYSNVGIDGLNGAIGLHVFPNPNSGHFTVGIVHAGESAIEVQLFDPLGRLVDNQSVIQQTGNHLVLEFNVDPVSQGVYHLKILAGEEIITRKVVIMN